jgi:hypothetical protein
MKRILIPFVLAFIALASPGCNKGCTDPAGSNYDPSAKRDNGGCTYDGSVVFYYDSLRTTGSVTVAMADGTYGIITYDLTGGIPTCGESRYFTYTNSPGIYTYTAVLNDNIVGEKRDSGTVTISSQQCFEYNIPF